MARALDRPLPRAAIRYLRRRGLAVLAVDYPGHGASTGRPSEAGCYRAAKAAWEHLRDVERCAPADVIVYGRSLGASVAAWLAAHEGPRGLVFHGGFPSVPAVAELHLPRWLVTLGCRLRLDGAAWIRRGACPVLQIHGNRDQHLPMSLARLVLEGTTCPSRFFETEDDHTGDGWGYSAQISEAFGDLREGRAPGWSSFAARAGAAPDLQLTSKSAGQ